MFRRIKPFPVLTFLMAVLLLCAACSTEDAQEEPQDGEGFQIGIIPAQGSQQMQQGADKLAVLLTEALGRPVRAGVYPDYNGVVEAMGADKVQMAYLGPLTYVEANERYNVRAIVTQLIDGKPYYHSQLIVPADSPYQSLEDLIAHAAEVRWAFGDINSTSGSLIPGIMLKDRGVFTSQQNHSFESVIYTGDHLATALAVLHKRQDAGAIDSAILRNLIKQGQIDGQKLKIIWESEPLFQYPWAVVPSVTDEEARKIQEAMMAIKDPGILDAFGGASAFTTAEDADYEAIRQAAIADGRIR